MKTIKFPFDVDKFFKKCIKHQNIPKNDFEKQVILINLIKEFKDGIIYAEEEVNNKIRRHFNEDTLLRRELINFGYMQRDPLKGEYWLLKEP